jgi:diguanylate cyclase (GGDEF)-like protein/PAS domain S-box-containing protein
MERFLSEKSNNLLQPVDPYTLADLIPPEDLQQLQDTLAEINQVTSVITDHNGSALTMPSNEMPICNLIRRSARGEARCLAEEHAVINKIREIRKPVCQICRPLGFLNAAVPIYINGNHLGNWWVRQQCRHPDNYADIETLADTLDLDAEVLMAQIEGLPDCNRAAFEKVLDWIDNLVTTITQIGLQNHILSLNASKLDRVEGELQKYKTRLENLVHERTAELIKANSRLQLEVLERNVVEKQIERKSNLLDAMNNILQHTLDDCSDAFISHAFLSAAQKITSSGFGFIVELTEKRWKIVAYSPFQDEAGKAESGDRVIVDLEMRGFWRELIATGRPRTIAHMEGSHRLLGLPAQFPILQNILAVPLCKNDDIMGIIVLGNNKRGFALVDQTDVEALSRVFIEAVLRKRVERDEETREKRIDLAMNSGNEGLWDYSPSSGLIYFSPNWFRLLGYQPGELPSAFETWSTLTHPDDFPVLQEALDMLAMGQEQSFRIETRMLAQPGQWQWVQTRGRSVEGHVSGRSLRIVGTLNDISKYKQIELALQKANEELQRLAVLDGLTQIANRMRFDDHLSQEWRRARRDGSSLALIIGDIDYFKQYNDTYGHIKGDETLYAVAQAIKAVLKRPMDMVARYGGEEFAIVLPNTHLSGAMQVGSEVKASIEALAIGHKASRVKKQITLSYGVAAAVPNAKNSARDLVRNADQALYKAKRTGRNRIVKMSEPAS